MFIVTASRGSHDDREDWNEVCSPNKAKLEAWVRSAELRDEAEAAYQLNLHEFHQAFVKANPIPAPSLSYMSVARWPSGLGTKDITPAMAHERRLIEDNNANWHKEATALNQKWLNEKWFPAFRQFEIDNNRTPIDDDILGLHNTTGSTYFENVFYNIEEIEEI